MQVIDQRAIYPDAFLLLREDGGSPEIAVILKEKEGEINRWIIVKRKLTACPDIW